MHKSTAKLAFTLAEILITLIVIGVIAAITIPALVNDIQDAQYKTTWKNTFANITQATKLIMKDNGDTMKGVCGDWDYNCLMNKYANYLNYTKKCSSGEALGNCWTATYTYDNVLLGYQDTTLSRITLTNGTMLRFAQFSTSCSFTDAVTTIPICGNIAVDINGFKGPNVVGKDIFSIWIQKDGIKPYGTSGDTYHDPASDCVSYWHGEGCSAVYLHE